MPTMTVIIISVLVPLLLWTLIVLIRDVARKLGKRPDIRGRSDEIRASIDVERERDRQRMGSMFASSIMRGRSADDRDKS